MIFVLILIGDERESSWYRVVLEYIGYQDEPNEYFSLVPSLKAIHSPYRAFQRAFYEAY